jgi:hypothetical protein
MAGEITYDETNLALALEWIDWKSLVLHDESGMGDVITGVSEGFRNQNIKVLLAYDGKEVVGWAWSLNYSNSNGSRRRGLMLYIKGPYRRKGIGTRCVKWGQDVARKHHMKFMCFPWDDQSESFFEDLNIKDKNQGWWI